MSLTAPPSTAPCKTAAPTATPFRPGSRPCGAPSRQEVAHDSVAVTFGCASIRRPPLPGCRSVDIFASSQRLCSQSLHRLHRAFDQFAHQLLQPHRVILTACDRTPNGRRDEGKVDVRSTSAKSSILSCLFRRFFSRLHRHAGPCPGHVVLLS